MTQTATVRRIVSPKRAEITVRRASACGHDCADCGGCKVYDKPQVIALAENTVGAQVGDSVEVESGTAHVLGLAAAVYLAPFILFFLLYFAGGVLNLSEMAALTLGGVGFLSGIGIDLLLNRALRRRRTPTFRIVEVRPCLDI